IYFRFAKMNNLITYWPNNYILIILFLLITACSATPSESSLTPTSRPPNASPQPSLTSLPSATTTQTPTLMPTSTATIIPSATPIPVLIKGVVTQQSNCRYGPGAAYLYKFGFYENISVTVEGRNEKGDWAWVQGLWFPDQCWIKTNLLNLDGDIMGMPFFQHRLPFSVLYLPPTGVSAERDGDIVTVHWNSANMTEDDDRGYLVEAWLCRNDEFAFYPIGANITLANILDETGCEEESHANLYTVEKHGYTQWIKINWPPAQIPTPSQ
ncbi:MAG: hypothetical protein N2D54_07030, partial [Chloroflexota bacterium]